MSDTQYFNFPVQILKGIFEDKKKVLNDILYCALYSHSLKLNDGYRYPRGENSSEYKDFMAACTWYCVDLKGNEKERKEKMYHGRMLINGLPANSPKVGLNISIWWDYYLNEKSDFDIACLTAFLAIKSILGTKPYCRTDNSFLWARMSGNSKAMKDQSELTPGVLKFANEYQTKKIKRALRDGWGLIHYAFHTRGFYVSFTLDLPALVMEAEKRKKSTKEKQYQQYEKDVRKQVLESLYKPLVSPL